MNKIKKLIKCTLNYPILLYRKVLTVFFQGEIKLQKKFAKKKKKYINSLSLLRNKYQNQLQTTQNSIGMFMKNNRNNHTNNHKVS